MNIAEKRKDSGTPSSPDFSVPFIPSYEPSSSSASDSGDSGGSDSGGGAAEITAGAIVALLEKHHTWQRTCPVCLSSCATVALTQLIYKFEV